MITSIVPGRARLRNPCLRDPQVLEAHRKALEAMSEVEAVSANPAVGSLLVRFDPRAIGVDSMREKLEALAASRSDAGTRQREVADTDADPSAVQSTAGPGVNLGQGVKLGMLASLGSSLFWAYLGKKGPHKQTGGLFMVTLAAHLWMYRHRLLK